MTSIVDFKTLYYAQAKAHAIFQTDWFPCYSSNYVENQKGITYFRLKCCNGIYSTVEWVTFLTVQAAKVANSVFGPMIKTGESIFSSIYPVNQINGKRHFIFISKGFEKWLGDTIFYPLNGGNWPETYEELYDTNIGISAKVLDVINKLKDNNKELLNSRTDPIKFEYRVKTVPSSSMNAFAVPGGGMVVFSQLVKELHGAITLANTEPLKILETKIELEDGSQVTVDLKDVSLDDVLAALLGHEMTHVASRHSMTSICIRIVTSIVFKIGGIALVLYLKNSDKECVRLNTKLASQRTHKENRALQEKESHFQKLNNLCSWISDRIQFSGNLLRSRTHEYEADVTGAYLAKQAGYNSLGAIYLQEFLSRQNPSQNFFHKHFEFLFTHPYGENRKKALFAAINTWDPLTQKIIKEKTTFADQTSYDPTHLSPAYAHSLEIRNAVSL